MTRSKRSSQNGITGVGGQVNDTTSSLRKRWVPLAIVVDELSRFSFRDLWDVEVAWGEG